VGDRDVAQPGSRRLSRADARLRRPVVDPAIPRADRTLLTDPRTPLTAACQSRPARRRDYLPREPGRRLATVDGAAIGLTGAMMIAVFGTVPLAVGVLALQETTPWESASSHYALLAAEIIAIITMSATLANSDGSTWNPPGSEIHAFAPLTSEPSGVSTASRASRVAP